jgi:hypothetical protein
LEWGDEVAIQQPSHLAAEIAACAANMTDFYSEN